MSIDRQFGVHELPGTEAPAPQMKRETVSAGFELQMRGYVNAIWAKIAELEGRIDDFEGWRTAIALALKDATGIDPRTSASSVSSRPLLAVAGGARGEGSAPPISPPKPRSEKPWEAEGVSRRTWYRRQKGCVTS
jgi:hypothetical protein